MIIRIYTWPSVLNCTILLASIRINKITIIALFKWTNPSSISTVIAYWMIFFIRKASVIWIYHAANTWQVIKSKITFFSWTLPNTIIANWAKTCSVKICKLSSFWAIESWFLHILRFSKHLWLSFVVLFCLNPDYSSDYILTNFDIVDSG